MRLKKKIKSEKTKPLKRLATAPAPQRQMTSAPVGVHNVFLADTEEVVWTWTHTPSGSYVSGYRIVKRTANAHE